MGKIKTQCPNEICGADVGQTCYCKSESALNDLLYVRAKRIDEAISYACSLGYRHNNVVFIYKQDQLRGIDGWGKDIHMLDGYLDREDHNDFMSMAISRGFGFKYV